MGDGVGGGVDERKLRSDIPTKPVSLGAIFRLFFGFYTQNQRPVYPAPSETYADHDDILTFDLRTSSRR